MASLTARTAEAINRRLAGVRGALASPARSTRGAVVIGRLLGAAFVICFLTGLYSHFLQDPQPWMRFPTRPANLYQLTQGTHVTSGIAIFPLLLAKLWTVYPRLFVWPVARSIPELAERAQIGALVALALVEPVTGLLNTAQWYAWAFPFRQTHYALAWAVAGLLCLHVAVKLPEITRHWRVGRTAESAGGDGDRR